MPWNITYHPARVRGALSTFFTSLAAATIVCLAAERVAIAQEALLGTYTGSFTAARGPKPFEANIELTVTTVDSGIVKAEAKILNGKCAGAYAMEGNAEGNRLQLRASAGPCPMSFELAYTGGNLVGTTGAGGPMRLSRSTGGAERQAEKNPGARLIGTFKGSFRGSEQYHIYIGMALEIREVTNIGLVKGSLTIYQGPCAGGYQMQGRYQGNELRIRAVEGPCLPYGFVLTHEGDQLSGSNALGAPIQLIR